eukprot:m.20557 g.20557  ORF g.20557 m.20557 type:complete len:193 (+) comp28028_c0_seq1:109-687(+)
MAAAFADNRCMWAGCGLVFATHYDLIRHIEIFHIETDAVFLHQQELCQPIALPLSYVCRYFGSTAKRRRTSLEEGDGFSSTSDGSEGRSSPLLPVIDSGDPTKPFVCPVPGCRKRYKNANGMRYHSQHGHVKDGGVQRSVASFRRHSAEQQRLFVPVMPQSLHYGRPAPPYPHQQSSRRTGKAADEVPDQEL